MGSIKELLIELNLSTHDSIQIFHPNVRDTEEIKVLKCNLSGTIFLDTSEYSCKETYSNVEGFSYWNKSWNKHKKVTTPVPPIYEDDHRRKEQFLNLIRGKKWLDFGCGTGGVLRLCKDVANEAIGLELQPSPRSYLNDIGIQCYENFDQIDDNSLDIITLFHVYEHLDSPIEILQMLKNKLVDNGKIIIEVPQANDILISLFNSRPFKNFTFWSEHLILHTRKTLEQFILKTGLKVEAIQAYQRYPLSNHLHWLVKESPGGHAKWSFLNNPMIEEAYSKTLQSVDMTDTLIAFAVK
jgi:2-polyprenyl-3-methyl-5-hydroxy-6-metoxy-1,4-benzoquinol methylase